MFNNIYVKVAALVLPMLAFYLIAFEPFNPGAPETAIAQLNILLYLLLSVPFLIVYGIAIYFNKLWLDDQKQDTNSTINLLIITVLLVFAHGAYAINNFMR